MSSAVLSAVAMRHTGSNHMNIVETVLSEGLLYRPKKGSATFVDIISHHEGPEGGPRGAHEESVSRLEKSLVPYVVLWPRLQQDYVFDLASSAQLLSLSISTP